MTLAERHLAHERQAGDAESIAIALHRLRVILVDNGEYGRALPALDECVALFRAMGNVPMRIDLARALCARAKAVRFLGDYRQALADFDECERANREGVAVRAWLHVQVTFQRGLALLGMGDEAAGVAVIKASLRRFQELRDASDQPPLAMAALAEVAWSRGQFQPAMRLAGAAAAFENEERLNNPSERIEYDRTIAEARARLDDPALAEAWAEGQLCRADRC